MSDKSGHTCPTPDEATWGQEWTCPACGTAYSAEPDDEGEVFEWTPGDRLVENHRPVGDHLDGRS